MGRYLNENKYFCDVCGKEASNFTYVLPSKCDANGKMAEIYQNLCPECEEKLLNLLHCKFNSINKERQIVRNEDYIVEEVNDIQIDTICINKNTGKKEVVEIEFRNCEDPCIRINKDVQDTLFEDSKIKTAYNIEFQGATMEYYKKGTR